MLRNSARNARVLAGNSVATLAIVAGLASCSDHDIDAEPSGARQLAPVVVPPAELPLLRIDPSELRGLEERLLTVIRDAEKGSIKPANLVHAVRLSGPEAMLGADGPGARPIIDILLDNRVSEAVFGRPALSTTRYGVRFRWPSNLYFHAGRQREAHFDQVLAALAEAGVSRARTCFVGPGEHRAVDDVLRDALANFDLSRPEIEWTALAATLYLAHDRSWRNRFGEVVSLDDVASVLMGPIEQPRSCYGTHVLYTLIIMLRVDRSHGILGSSTSRDLARHVESRVEAAVASQLGSGAWPAAWLGDSAGGESAEEPSFLATSHLAECLLYLPEDMRPPDEVIASAGTWLRRKVASVFATGDPAAWICPLTHSLCVLRCLRVP